MALTSIGRLVGTCGGSTRNRAPPVEATLHGWGRYPVARCRVHEPVDDAALRRALASGPVIARGNGRSYGDSSLQVRGTLLTSRLGRALDLDPVTGVVECDSGVLLADILDHAVPQGWFLPATPGTKFVSVGGAIAADVHGKNHHRCGGFGRHVPWLDLMRADGHVVRCSAEVHPDLFEATIGGMGLTGVIRRAAIRLIPVETAWVRQETKVAPDLYTAIAALDESNEWTYVVAWIDSLAGGASLGRSLIHRGEHAVPEELPEVARATPLLPPSKRTVRMPFDVPGGFLTRWTARAFNVAYWERHRRHPPVKIVDYDSFFYPLDGLLDWNRVYGRGGFLQYQCVFPLEASRAGLTRLLDEIGRSGLGSFLAVLKLLGPPGGGLSFPMRGYTLSLDFPFTPPLLALLDRLDAIVVDHGGRIYLAKDARMNARTFERSYAALGWFEQVRRRHGATGVFRSRQAERLGLA